MTTRSAACDLAAPTVSVIVALYNPGAELDGFLEKFVSLTDDPGVELVLIDDFSTDGTRDRLASWPRPRNCRVLYNEANLGVALSRNRALEQAVGEFVWFIDHDDDWDVSGLAALRAHASTADIVIGSADYRYGATALERRSIERAPSLGTVKSSEAARLLLEGVVQGFLWTKLFRRSVLGAEPFPQQRSQSDVVGVARAIATAQSVTFIGDTVYTYVRRAGSITRGSASQLASLGSARREVLAAIGSHASDGQADFFTAWFYCLAAVKSAVRWSASTADAAEGVAAAATQARNLSLRLVGRRSPALGALIVFVRIAPGLVPPVLAFLFAGLDSWREVRTHSRTGLRRLVGFAAVPMIAAVTPLLTLPAITSISGQSGWVAVAIGQSVGGIGATAVELGWSQLGVQRVARQAGRARLRHAALALAARALASAAVVIVCGVVAFLLSGAYRWEAAGVAATTALISNSLVWYFVGASAPRLILLTDTAPRCVFALLSVFCLYSSGQLWTYVALTAIGCLIAPLVGCMAIGVRPRHFRGYTPRRVLRAVRLHSVQVTGSLLSAGYIVLPVTLISIVAPGAVASFAAADRMQRMVLNAVSSFPNAFQSWVGSGAREERVRRGLVSLGINTVFGLVIGLAFALAAPLASRFLFSGVVSLAPSFAVLCGLLILVTCVSRATGGLLLPAMGRVGVVARSAALGLIVGVPLILAGGLVDGARGGLIATLTAEVGVLVVQFTGIRTGLRTREAAR